MRKTRKDKNSIASGSSAKQLSRWDRQYVWHPFTQMREWKEEESLIIDKAQGPYVWDMDGIKYFDGVSSLWVNVHGHRHPTIDHAIRKQLNKVAHSTLLGLANPPSILLAKELVKLAPRGLTHVFYSDDGSTALEVALKLAIQYWQQQTRQEKKKKKFVRLDLAYHGDTAGSMSVGGISLFHERFRSLLFPSISVPAPYCYRCPLELDYPSCKMSCIDPLKKVLTQKHKEIAGLIIEPMIQGVAGMIPSPPGYLQTVRELCTRFNVLMIADEVATGFGRTGKMFACEHEKVSPDLMALSKGITGGYLPLGATLTTKKIYDSFLGEYGECRHFFHGHSYTGNALACAAALASLQVFKDEQTLRRLKKKVALLKEILKPLVALPQVGDIRQCGMMVGIELVKDKKSRKPYLLTDRMGHQVAMECRRRRLLIRPIGNVLVLMPPLSSTANELRLMGSILLKAISSIRTQI